MISLEKLLGDEIYYYDDVESFIMQVKKILAAEDNEKRYRSLAMKYDWREMAQRYEKVLQKASHHELK
jgi:glycosyltransferase involved in cell wall biosynthesis